MKTSRISVSGGTPLAADNPFAALAPAAFKAAPPRAASPQPAPRAQPKRCGRLCVRRETKGRAGKTATVVFGEGFERTCPAEIEDALKCLKTALGCGGVRRDKTLELQGDCRESVVRFFVARGFDARLG